MAEQILTDATAQASVSTAERFQLVIHASAEALAVGDDADDDGPASTLADGTRLHPSTARRLTCNCPTSTLTVDADGSPLHLGRRHRRIRGRLLRAVHARDRGRCRAPGCTQAATQVHHIRHWANGGDTCLPNLISLCHAHHWLVHEGGFTIITRRPGQWALLSPAGVTIDPVPAPPADPGPPLPHDESLRDDAVSGHWDGTHLDIAYTTNLLNNQPNRPTTPTASTARTDASAEAGFDTDTLSRFYNHMTTMTERGASSNDIIYLNDDE
jgi:hypothetical protein